MKSALSRLVLASVPLLAPESAFAVTVHGASGVGTFQDIQVPYNEQYEIRGDGTAIQEENIGHQGLLLNAGIGKEMPRGRWLFQAFEFDALQIKSSGGPAATQASSYSRLNLESGATYRFPLGGLKASSGLKGGLRRTSYNNVSSAHYIESLLVGLTAGLSGELHAFNATLAVAPMTRFGYSEDGMFGGKEFQKSKASLFEVSAAYSYTLQDNVWLDLGVSQESARIELEDVNEYNELGYALSVLDSSNPTRSYAMSTVAARIGFRKAF